MRKFTISLFLMLFIGLQVAYAQRSITGKVTSSEDGAGLPGATVLVKGTTVGTITDANGAFTLLVPKDKETLLVSFVGMKTKEIALGTDNVVNVVLEPSVQQLEGVVVTALGIPREKNHSDMRHRRFRATICRLLKLRTSSTTSPGKSPGFRYNRIPTWEDHPILSFVVINR